MSINHCICKFRMKIISSKQFFGKFIVRFSHAKVYYAYQYCSIVWRRLVILVLGLESEFRIEFPFRPFRLLSDLNSPNFWQLPEHLDQPHRHHSVVCTGPRCKVPALLESFRWILSIFESKFSLPFRILNILTYITFVSLILRKELISTENPESGL